MANIYCCRCNEEVNLGKKGVVINVSYLSNLIIVVCEKEECLSDLRKFIEGVEIGK